MPEPKVNVASAQALDTVARQMRAERDAEIARELERAEQVAQSLARLLGQPA